MENSPVVLEDLNFTKELIGKSVRIQTIDKEVHEGKLYVVDPISKTVVLTAQNSIIIVMYHAIKSFEVASGGAEDTTAHLEAVLVGSDTEHRKTRLKDWLRRNRIEVVEDGLVLKIHDGVQIGPPYTIDQCSCSNKIVLERIVAIIEKMSENDELNSG